MPPQFLSGTLYALAVAAASYAVRFLTLSGAVATFLLGTVVFGIGGWPFAIPILAFFLPSSLLSKYGRSRKEQYNTLFEKSHTRDWGQVAANGSIAGVAVSFSAIFPIYDFYPMYLGALAASTADTWGTEIGVLTGGRTVSVLSLKPVTPGTSGGISEKGTMAGVVGALVIALSGYLWFSDVKTAIIVVLAGIAGSLGDSVVGATLQAQFRCNVCGGVDRTYQALWQARDAHFRRGLDQQRYCEPAQFSCGSSDSVGFVDCPVTMLKFTISHHVGCLQEIRTSPRTRGGVDASNKTLYINMTSGRSTRSAFISRDVAECACQRALPGLSP